MTTIVTGNCGGGVLDVAKYFAAIDAHGAGTNVIHLVPHGEVRSAILGNAERAPTRSELDRMKQLVERGMQAGAWGLSTGLIYVPGRYAETDELIELARVVRRHGGIYATHIRNEGAGLLAAIDEAIAVGEGAKLPVHVSHLKASGKPNWGDGPRGARADRRGPGRGHDGLGRPVSLHRLEHAAGGDGRPALGRQGRRQRVRAARRRPGAGRRAAPRDPPRAGRSGTAGRRSGSRGTTRGPSGPASTWPRSPRRAGTTPLEVVLDIQRHGGAQAISFGMCEDDVREVMRHAFVATASDGATHLPGRGDQPHPRGYGTFPRKIRYALDDKVITLEQAIRSCSGWPAEILGLADRGVIRAGAFADIVVFDPKTFRDAATFDHPTRYAPGVRHLFVNGVPMIVDGRLRSDAGPGRQAAGPGLAAAPATGRPS